MRNLRVENTLYPLPDKVWREVNDLLAPFADGATQLTQEMLKDETPVDEPTGSGPTAFGDGGEVVDVEAEDQSGGAPETATEERGNVGDNATAGGEAKAHQ